MRARSLVASAIFLALGSLPVAAETSEELAQLRREAADLRQALDRLDARIHALEGRSADPVARKDSAPLPAAANLQPILALKQTWSQIERGTSQQKVQSLLGPPGQVLLIDGSTVWYYAYPGIGRASVFLDGNGIVSSVQSPSFGW